MTNPWGVRGDVDLHDLQGPNDQPEVPAGVRAPGGGASGAVIPPGDSAPIQLHPRRASVSSVDELDRYLARRLEALAQDCQPDVIEAIGLAAHNRSLGAYSALTELRGLIGEWRSEEEADRAADAEYDRWKEATAADRYRAAGFDQLDPLMQRAMDGDR